MNDSYPKGQLRIESDGKTIGTRVFVGDEEVYVSSITWQVAVGTGFAKATIEIDNVAVNLLADEGCVATTIKVPE